MAIVGPSNSGKTELICRLLTWFASQGLRVAVLKHTHKTEIGDQGKDTWRYRQAGARLVALAGPGFLQVTQLLPDDPPLTGVLAALAADADLILVEGYKTGPLPKVAVMGAGAQLPVPDYPQTVAIVSPEPVTCPQPVFHPQDAAAIGRFIREYLGIG